MRVRTQVAVRVRAKEGFRLPRPSRPCKWDSVGRIPRKIILSTGSGALEHRA